MQRANLISIVGMILCCALSKISLSQTSPSRFDTSQYIVLPYDFRDSVFQGPVKVSSLTLTEVKSIDLILKKTISDYNKKETSDYFRIRSLSEYKIQLIPVIDQNGDKIVWINGFCSSDWTTSWRKEVIHIADGGNCVITMLINLTTGNDGEIYINGYARQHAANISICAIRAAEYRPSTFGILFNFINLAVIKI